MTSMGRYMSPRYDQVILVSGYPVLTAVNCSQHWCPICVHCQFPVLSNLLESMRLNIDRDLVSGQLPNKSRHLDELTHTRDMVMWYWSVAILFWQLSIDHFENVQYTRCGLAKTRLRHSSLLFVSLPYPTLTICWRVRTLGQSRDNQTKRDWPYSMSVGLYPTRVWDPR